MYTMAALSELAKTSGYTLLIANIAYFLATGENLPGPY
jgi:hypothetical protein